MHHLHTNLLTDPARPEPLHVFTSGCLPLHYYWKTGPAFTPAYWGILPALSSLMLSHQEAFLSIIISVLRLWLVTCLLLRPVRSCRGRQQEEEKEKALLMTRSLISRGKPCTEPGFTSLADVMLSRCGPADCLPSELAQSFPAQASRRWNHKLLKMHLHDPPPPPPLHPLQQPLSLKLLD